jgi:CelD/BcsL family acetyltransferase involved in cellulose biosynthesis
LRLSYHSRFYQEEQLAIAHFVSLPINLMLARSESIIPVDHELRRGDKPIAFNFGIEMGQNYVEPKGTYAEDERKYGPGHLIIHEIVADLQERGFTRYGLLGHVEPYKELWSSTTIQHHHYLLFRKNPVGQAMQFAVERLIPIVKSWRGRMAAATAKVLAMIPFVNETTGTTTWML